METIKIDRKNCKLVAHQGSSRFHPGNTCPAFVVAACKTYYGIETDIHTTKDGKFIICHNDDVFDYTGVHKVIEESAFDEIRAIPIFDFDQKSTRSDLVFPTEKDYFSICKGGDKVPVLELKNTMPEPAIDKLVDICKEMGLLDKIIFISFSRENMVYLRKILPNAKLQYLTDKISEDLRQFLLNNDLDLDIYYEALTEQFLNQLHSDGKEVNVWTVDEKEDADRLIAWGVDYLTTNILE